MASTTATLLLHQVLPLLCSRVAPFARCYADAISSLESISAARVGEAAPPPPSSLTVVGGGASATPPKPPKPQIPLNSWADHPDFRLWKEKEEEILSDIEPITLLAKEILHSGRYLDGERQTDEDEKEVVEKLLNYHPHSEDKIGCGLDSLMVDLHPTFRKSRCLFVIRTDGGWIDFSLSEMPSSIHSTEVSISCGSYFNAKIESRLSSSISLITSLILYNLQSIPASKISTFSIQASICSKMKLTQLSCTFVGDKKERRQPLTLLKDSICTKQKRKR